MSGEAVTLTFGPFELDPARRQLRRANQDLRLGSRSLDLLLALVEQPGTVLTHRELTDRLWPTSIVDNSALRVYVSALRRALGDGEAGARYIVNEHGRGYRFVAAVRKSSALPDRAANLPMPASRFIGPTDCLDHIAAAFGRHRMVTLVGPGGIGKSTAALTAAARMRGAFPGGAWFVDLAIVEDGPSVASAVATALAASAAPGREVRAIADCLPAQPVLIILDNCEHVIAAVAQFVTALLQTAPQVSILATGREPTRIAAEQIVRIPALGVPTETQSLDAPSAAQFSAVELFMERASTAMPGFVLSDENATLVGALCRQLDGIPLALEFAAGWVGVMSIETIFSSIDGQLLTLTGSARSPLPRHRTLAAVLDWSFSTLSGEEQRVLVSLGVFRGSFSLESARAVVLPGDAVALADILDRLVEKSLLSSDQRSGATSFRLLEITRAFARKHLEARGDAREIQARHATHCIALLRGADEQLMHLPLHEWQGRYASVLADVRTAFAWAFSPAGDGSIGVELARVSMQTALQSVVPGEFRRYFTAALTHLQASLSPDHDLVVRLTHTVDMLSAHPGTPGRPEGPAAPAHSGDGSVVPEELASGFGLSFTRGDYPLAAEYADAILAYGHHRNLQPYIYAGSRMRAQVLHYRGQHDEARTLAQWVLDAPLQFLPLTNVSHHISMRIILARIAYLQGDAVQAQALAERATALAQSSNPQALCQALTAALIPVQASQGDTSAMRASLAVLKSTAHRHDMQYWINWAEGLAVGTALLLPGGTHNAVQIRFALSLRPLTGKLVDLLATLDARLVTPLARSRVRAGTVGWSAPEVLRADALESDDPQRRQILLRDALALANAQGARLFAARAEALLVQMPTSWSPPVEAAAGMLQ